MGRRMKKKTRKHAEEKDKDRLSNLPDHVIHHIFSFLDTQFSVQTCILSKRWKSLWVSAQNLHFGNLFSDNFVSQVLARRSGDIPVTKLYLCPGELETKLKKSLAERVIDYAASHSVQHLSISADHFAPLAILSPVDSSESLKILCLSGFMEVSLLSFFDLPMLTTLHLTNCCFSSLRYRSFDYSVDPGPDPFASLINLKSLILTRFFTTGFSILKISGPELESLTINKIRNTRNRGNMPSYDGLAGFKVEIFAPKLKSFSYFDLPFSYDELADFKIEIFAPKLKSFSFRNTHPLEFSHLDFPLLEIADIDAYLPSSKDREKFENVHLNLINMLQGLYHAESLNLSSNTIEVLMEVPGELEHQSSPFSRLKTLKLQCYNNSLNIPAKLMKYFLNGSIFVENVRIECEKHCNMLRGLYHTEFLKLSSNTIEILMEVPGGLEHQSSPFSRLKTLKLQCCNNSLNIPAKLMKYFLNGSISVENVRIECEKVRYMFTPEFYPPMDD